MGFFSKLTESTGVHVELSAPDNVPIDATSFDATVTLSADKPAAVKEIVVRLYEQTGGGLRAGGISVGSATNETESASERTEVIALHHPGPIQLTPGQPVAVPVQVPVAGNALAALAKATSGSSRILQALSAVAQADARLQAMEYELHAHATIENSYHHPHARRRIWIGQGGGWHTGF